MDHVIQTTALTKRWGEVVAVNGVDLAVEAGECYAFLGLNGAGKSTTARMLLDFIRPTSGTSRVLGGLGSDPEIRRRVGYLPGDLNLPRTMTGADAIAYFGGLSGPDASAGSDALIERLGLNPGRPVRELSTGNRRKVGLVLAFMGDPELLILDEPTSGLDPLLQEEFRDLLAERKAQGATIWLTSHVMAEVERVADRVGLLRDGQLARELTMEDLRHQASTAIRFTFRDPVEAHALERVPGVTDVSVQGSEVRVQVTGPVAALLSVAGSMGALRIETERQDLDDIFLDMFDRKEVKA